MKKIILFSILAIILVQTASAFTFLNIYLDESGKATFIGETSEIIQLPSGIKMSGSNIIGETQTLTSKSGEFWSFNYSIKDSEINLILPKGTVIKTISNGEISINKEQISVFFIEKISITYTIEESFTDSLGISSNSLLLGIILLGVSIILVVFLINYSKREKEEDKKETKEKKPDKLKLLSKILSEREKLILSTLKKSGKVKQSHLRKLTNIPKASFSRHIQELEKKKLIKRSGEGKNKFVELKK